MTIRWYRLAVFALWLGAMSWLAVCKILPPFLIGGPPAYEAADADTPGPPVAWYIYLNGRRLGWALSEVSRQSETAEIHSLVHIDNLPWKEFLPIYLRGIASAGTRAAGPTEMEVESNLITNSALSQLVSFDSRFRAKGRQQSLVKIEGVVEGDKLKFSVHVGNTAWDSELPMPDSKVRDGFAPELQLRGLRMGQRWKIMSYSPLALPTHPLDMIEGRPPTEVLFAKVEERTPLTWNEKSEPMWVVVYRSDTSDGPDNEKNIRNRLWVHRDGTVVQQEVFLGDHRLLFKRIPEKDATSLRDKHNEFNKPQSAGQP
jgi:hypothetical protein